VDWQLGPLPPPCWIQAVKKKENHLENGAAVAHRSFKAILFDFNGVLVDDEPLHRDLLGQTLLAEGMTFSPDEYPRLYLGLDDRRCYQRAFQSHGRHQEAADLNRIDQLIARKTALYQEVLRTAPPGAFLFPGIAALVAQLGQSIPLAIVSGALRAEIAVTIERAGLGPYFQQIISAEDVTQSKPDPEGYLRAFTALQDRFGPLAAADCLAIEDSVAGVAAARAAGLRCLAVTTSYPSADLSHADWICSEIPGWFLTAPA
jgi:beta-phosphoglucomutase